MNYGGSDESINQQAFLKQVDEVAKLMCKEMGCDPEFTVPVESIDECNILGIEFRVVTPKIVHDPGVAPPYFVAKDAYGNRPYSGSVTHVHYIPLWRSLRPAAAEALAGWRAVHKWALVGETA